MHDKYSNIKDKIQTCYEKHNNVSDAKKRPNQDFHAILSYAIDFFSCAITGTIIGYILDKVFLTKYIFIILLFLLGIIAGIYNVLKKYKHL